MRPATLFAGIALLISTPSQADEVVLFDAATPLTSLSAVSNAKVARQDGALIITTDASGEAGGVLLKGTWDLSKCNQLVIEMMTRDNAGPLPIKVQLGTPGYNFAKWRNVWYGAAKIRGDDPKAYRLKLPPYVPGISGKLFGMRKGPFPTPGYATDLDTSKVANATLTVGQTAAKTSRQWCLKRSVAWTGPAEDTPAWMKLSPEEFFPFIDVYGQFKHKDWPGKIHSDAELKAALDRERIDLA